MSAFDDLKPAVEAAVAKLTAHAAELAAEKAAHAVTQTALDAAGNTVLQYEADLAALKEQLVAATSG